jgi:hypothetical protein
MLSGQPLLSPSSLERESSSELTQPKVVDDYRGTVGLQKTKAQNPTR